MYHVSYILTLFPCCFFYVLCNTYFSSGARSKSFWIHILCHKYDTLTIVDINYALTECYRVRSNSYMISHERDCISRFMGQCDVLKLLKIARAVSNVSVWNVRHMNLKSNLILLLAKKLYSWFVHLCKRELLCQGQGLARSLPPTAVVHRNSTAINSHSLLMYTSVLSGTLVTDRCSAEQ